MKLSQININGSPVSLSDLVIIVGPNGSGKTTFLRDLHRGYLLTKPDEPMGDNSMKWKNVVQENSLTTTSQEWREWFESIIPISGSPDEGHALPNYLARSDKNTYLNGGMKLKLESWLSENITEKQKLEGLGNSAANQAFRDQQSIYLSVDDRFYVSRNSSNQVRYDQMNSMNVVSFLAKHPEALRRINTSLYEMFRKNIRIETPGYPVYNIISVNKLTPQMQRLPQTPEGFQKQPELYDDWLTNNSLSILAEEGHGVRAAVEILYALQLRTNKIIFLDEPELHLYPSTKYSLGQTIARYTKGQDKKQVILVTHDTDMLAGLLHLANNATIIRINKDRSITTATSKKIRQTTESNFLSGAFLDAAILVEGIDDAYVYNRVFRHKKILQDHSYNFVPCHGKDRMTDNLTVYQNLKIPFAMIVDFDALYSHKRNEGLMEGYLKSLGLDLARQQHIESQLANVRQLIADKDDKKRGLRMTGLTLSKIRSIEGVLAELEKEGIFVIPVGELEDWVGVSKLQKDPNEIVNMYISASNTKYKELSKFVARVQDYVRSVMGR